MENKINELRNTAMLDINRWVGLSNKPGIYGTLVMSDGKVCNYENYHNFTIDAAEKMQKELDGLSQEERAIKTRELFEKTKIANIEEVCNLSKNEVDKLIRYLVDEEKVFETKYEENFILDVGYYITVNIEGKTITIKNNVSNNETEPKLYERVKKYLSKVIDSK